MTTRFWWLISSAVSIACVLITVFAWRGEMRETAPRPGQVYDELSVDAVVQDYLERSRSPAAPIIVPTGIFIRSVHFETSSDVNLTGLIWQRYSSDIPEEVARGILLPGQVNSDTTVIEEIFRRESDGDEVIVWFFDATVRQAFDYSRYPLDRHDVGLRLWHRDFDRKVILTPDFGAYDRISPTRSFGIDRELVAGGWRIAGTWFGYTPARYDTNFGIANFTGRRDFPELYFHLSMNRSFVNAFVVNLVPLIVVVVLLFALLMSMTTDEEQSERFGFDLLAVLGSAAALLFVVILAHIELRNDFPGTRVSYMEIYYLVVYAVILLVGLVGYLQTYGGARRIARRYQVMPKLAYWPLLTGSIAVMTLLAF